METHILITQYLKTNYNTRTLSQATQLRVWKTTSKLATPEKFHEVNRDLKKNDELLKFLLILYLGYVKYETED